MDINRQIMKAYCAKDYTEDNPRPSGYCEVNIPDYLPTVPKDDKYTEMNISGSYFINGNYPITTGTIKNMHSVKLPVMRGTSCPTYLSKGEEFILISPNLQ